MKIQLKHKQDLEKTPLRGKSLAIAEALLSNSSSKSYSLFIDEAVKPILSCDQTDYTITGKAESPQLDRLKLSLLEVGSVGSADNSGWTWIGRSPKLQHPALLRANSVQPLVVSYYTLDTPYQQEAMKLKESLERVNAPHYIEGIADSGNWETNCSRKPDFLLRCLTQFKRPILWVDADAIVQALPTIGNGQLWDLGIHKISRWETVSGTLYLNPTDACFRFLKNWIQKSNQAPHIWDQIHMGNAWEETSSQCDLATLWLPQAFVKIFDHPWQPNEKRSAIVEHFQASRNLKDKIGSQTEGESLVIDKQLRLARLCSRPDTLSNRRTEKADKSAEKEPIPQFSDTNFRWYFDALLDTMASGSTLEIYSTKPKMATELWHHDLAAEILPVASSKDLQAVEDQSYDNLVLVHCLNQLPAKQVNAAIKELARICRKRMFVIVGSNTHRFYPDGEAVCVKSRQWWESLFFANGFKRTANATKILSADACLRSQYNTLLLLEKSEKDAKDYRASHNIDQIARASQYAFVAASIRPNDSVALLGDRIAEGAQQLFELSACDSIFKATPKKLAPRSVNIAFEHNYLNQVEDLESELALIKSALKPGGRLVSICDNAFHLLPTSEAPTVRTFDEVIEKINEAFLVENYFIQNTDTTHSRISEIEKCETNDIKTKRTRNASTLIAISMKSPLGQSGADYRETVFPDNGEKEQNPFSYHFHYENPWLVHSMVTYGFRAKSTEILSLLSSKTLDQAPAESPDYGAALCVKIYQAINGSSMGSDSWIMEINKEVDAYCRNRCDNPHVLRWKISLRFALAKLYSQDGKPRQSLAQLKHCLSYDCFKFSPHLATKTAEAHFLSGWISLSLGKRRAARNAWKRGVGFGDRLLKSDMKSILVDPRRPNRFDVGDGVREFALAFENVALCVNGLNFLNESKGRNQSPRVILNAFHNDRRLARQEFKNENDEILAKEGKHRLPSLIAKLKLKGCRTIAIYGAGAIGAYLAQHLPGAGIQISTLIDSFAKKGQTSGPFTVVLPKDAPALSLDAVVIASDAFKEIMTQSLQTAYKQANKPLPHLFQW